MDDTTIIKDAFLTICRIQNFTRELFVFLNDEEILGELDQVRNRMIHNIFKKNLPFYAESFYSFPSDFITVAKLVKNKYPEETSNLSTKAISMILSIFSKIWYEGMIWFEDYREDLLGIGLYKDIDRNTNNVNDNFYQ